MPVRETLLGTGRDELEMLVTFQAYDVVPSARLRAPPPRGRQEVQVASIVYLARKRVGCFQISLTNVGLSRRYEMLR